MLLLGAGCATHVSQPAPVKPSSVPFGGFETAILLPATVNPEFDENENAVIAINRHLSNKMTEPFPKLIVADEMTPDIIKGKTLIIAPYIKEIKFIGGGARFFVGAMAGSSAVLMKAYFKDAETEEIVADPEFLETAGAHSGAWSIGGSDNQMLENIADEVRDYAVRNK